MQAALHILATIVLMPYALLAIAVVFVGQAALSKSLGALLWTLLTQFLWVVPWGMVGFVAVFALIAGLGISVQLRWLGYLALAVLALASLLLIVILPGDRIDLGAFVFLAPCIAVLAVSAWYAAAELRAGSSAG